MNNSFFVIYQYVSIFPIFSTPFSTIAIVIGTIAGVVALLVLGCGIYYCYLTGRCPGRR